MLGVLPKLPTREELVTFLKNGQQLPEMFHLSGDADEKDKPCPISVYLARVYGFKNLTWDGWWIVTGTHSGVTFVFDGEDSPHAFMYMKFLRDANLRLADKLPQYYDGLKRDEILSLLEYVGDPDDDARAAADRIVNARATVAHLTQPAEGGATRRC